MSIILIYKRVSCPQILLLIIIKWLRNFHHLEDLETPEITSTIHKHIVNLHNQFFSKLFIFWIFTIYMKRWISELSREALRTFLDDEIISRKNSVVLGEFTVDRREKLLSQLEHEKKWIWVVYLGCVIEEPWIVTSISTCMGGPAEKNCVIWRSSPLPYI